jgi:hypothetical protein
VRGVGVFAANESSQCRARSQLKKTVQQAKGACVAHLLRSITGNYKFNTFLLIPSELNRINCHARTLLKNHSQ